jgi:hypothetical protein
VLPSRAAEPELAAGLPPVLEACPTSEPNLQGSKTHKLLEIKSMKAQNRNGSLSLKHFMFLPNTSGGR